MCSWQRRKKTKRNVKLKKGKTYYFQIKAYGTDAKKKNYYSQAELVCTTGFSKPADVKIAKTMHRWEAEDKMLWQSDKLTWKKVYGAKGYYVERYDEATGLFEQEAVISKPQTTSYTVTNQVKESLSENSTGVLYRVTAYAGNKREAGETISVKPQLSQTEKIAVKKSGKTVKVSWKAVVGAEKYRLYRSNGRGRVLLAETEKTAFTDPYLIEGVDVTYYVESVNQTLGFVSVAAASEPYRCDFGKVSGFKAKAVADGSVKLSWKKAKNAKSYVIYCAKEGSGKYTKVAEVKGSGKTYTHKNSGPRGTYQYKIVYLRANSAGLKVQSAPSRAKAKAGR